MSATNILLSGPLGKRYGRSHFVHLDTKTPAEAMRWLLSNFRGAREYFAGAAERGVEFAVFRGRGPHAENIGFEQMREPGGDVIRFAPVNVGAKSQGVLTTIVGAVLIVIGVIGNIYGGWGTPFIQAGIGMVAGGVVQMLSPQPKVNKAADAADNQASYIFNGPVNTTAQGGCVPILYGGPMEIGTTVISAGIEAMDYSSAPSNVDSGTADGNLSSNPYGS